MDNDKKPTESEDSNIAIVLDKLKAQDAKLADFQKRLDETLAFNRQLLSVTDTSTADKLVSKEARHQALEDKLNKALHKEQKEN